METFLVCSCLKMALRFNDLFIPLTLTVANLSWILKPTFAAVDLNGPSLSLFQKDK